jgi:phosphoribosylanthranilate isomerase
MSVTEIVAQERRLYPCIKVCGLTTLADSLLCAELGATALGFNCYPKSPRYLNRQQISDILLQVPPSIFKVAVVVYSGPGDDVSSVIDGPLADHFDAVQLHGVRSSKALPRTKRRLIVATSPEEADRFPGFDIIIDQSWGRGQLADWNRLRELDRAFILSGGLSPSNLGQALEMLNPSGVDVCSGVESEPGRKDPEKLKSFLRVAGEFYRKRVTGPCLDGE